MVLVPSPSWTQRGPDYYDKSDRYWAGVEVVRVGLTAGGFLPVCDRFEAQRTYDWMRDTACEHTLGTYLPPARFVQGRSSGIRLLDDPADPSLLVIPWTSKSGDALRFAATCAYAIRWQNTSKTSWYRQDSTWAGFTIAFADGLFGADVGLGLRECWEPLGLPVGKTRMTVRCSTCV